MNLEKSLFNSLRVKLVLHDVSTEFLKSMSVKGLKVTCYFNYYNIIRQIIYSQTYTNHNTYRNSHQELFCSLTNLVSLSSSSPSMTFFFHGYHNDTSHYHSSVTFCLLFLLLESLSTLKGEVLIISC